MGFLSRILGVDLDRDVRETAASRPVEFLADATLEQRILTVLDSVRPALRADGGDIELIEVVGTSARVRLTGACNGCPSAALTLKFGIEKKLKEAIPEFGELIPV